MSRNESPQMSRSISPETAFEVEVCYPNLTPLWAAFTDLEFLPEVKVALIPARQGRRQDRRRGMPDAEILVEEVAASQRDRLRYKVNPPLPAGMSLDAISGVISGCALIEHAMGKQYTITAFWKDTEEAAAKCAIAFAVVSADVAMMCNSAYLNEQPPAFRSTHSPRANHVTMSCDKPLSAPCSTPRSSSWRSRGIPSLSAPSSPTSNSKLRTTVFPLGPPLRDRDSVSPRAAHFHQKMMQTSARQRLPALYH